MHLHLICSLSVLVHVIHIYFAFACSWPLQFYASIEGKLPSYNIRIQLPETHRQDPYDGQKPPALTNTHLHMHVPQLIPGCSKVLIQTGTLWFFSHVALDMFDKERDMFQTLMILVARSTCSNDSHGKERHARHVRYAGRSVWRMKIDGYNVMLKLGWKRCLSDSEV